MRIPKRETEDYIVRKGYVVTHLGREFKGGMKLDLTKEEVKGKTHLIEKIAMPKKPITNINNRAILQNVHPVIEKRINEVMGIEIPKPLEIATVIIDKPRLKEINKKKEEEEKLKAEEEIKEKEELEKIKEEKKKSKRTRGKK